MTTFPLFVLRSVWMSPTSDETLEACMGMYLYLYSTCWDNSRNYTDVKNKPEESNKKQRDERRHTNFW